ncbi:MAG: NAD(+) synthase [Planctomycetales bacterium]|nr:NAD(+) synthase [Planctomycetales bacterium]
MRLVKVAAAVLNQTPLDWEGNARRIRAAIASAREQGATVLCLPELCITGYGCEDAFHASEVRRTATDLLFELVAETEGLVVSFGLPVMVAGGLFNAVAVAVDGRLEGLVAKQHLAGDGIHYEPRWFKPWPAGVVERVELRCDDAYPIGDLMFECGDVRIGFEICEDAWVGERPGARQAARGVDLILNPSASHFAFGKHEIRRRFILEGTRAFFVTYVYANLLGNEAGRAIYDGDAMIAAEGKVLASGPRFSYSEVKVTSAVTDIDATRMQRARTSSFRPALPSGPYVHEVAFRLPDAPFELASEEHAGWERSARLKFEEFGRAVALGMFDYLRKSHSRGWVVSLSGGADSAAVAVLAALAVHWSRAELGDEQVRQRIGFGPTDKPGLTDRDWVRLLLTTAYQATRNSGETTRHAAASVAESVGATHYELDVDALVEGYRERIEEAIGRRLSWTTDDIALQNIQARVRAPSVWMLANLSGALLLSTSNRSEAAVGYATMDGDTSGGLAPIAGIDKNFLRQWLAWLETEGPCDGRPIPELGVITAQTPTAELRPSESRQTDEADLMPYDLLDRIERLAIRDKRLPREVWTILRRERPGIARDQLLVWIERFFQLWCRNQWKRERYAPSFHLDDENLDPKTWCRFPILSSGFAQELRQLREEVANGVI